MSATSHGRSFIPGAVLQGIYPQDFSNDLLATLGCWHWTQRTPKPPTSSQELQHWLPVLRMPRETPPQQSCLNLGSSGPAISWEIEGPWCPCWCWSSLFIIVKLLEWRGNSCHVPWRKIGVEGSYRRSIHSLYHLSTLPWEPHCDAKVILLNNHSVPEAGLSPKGNASLQRDSGWPSSCICQNQDGKG